MSDLPDNPYQPPGDYLLEGETGDDPLAENGFPLTAGEVFRRAWTAFSKRWGLCVGSWFLAMAFFFGGATALMVYDVYFRHEVSIIPIVLMLPLWFLLIWLHIGVALICLKVARGDRVSIVLLFSGIRYVANILVTGLLFLICFEFGLILLIVPGVFFALMFSQAFYLILDDRESTVIDAFMESRRITEGRLWPLFGILGRLFLLSLPILIPFAGVLYLLAYLPFAYIVMAIVYLRLTGQPVATDR